MLLAACWWIAAGAFVGLSWLGKYSGALLLPIVLAYTVWCYRRMWGRVTAEEISARSHSAY